MGHSELDPAAQERCPWNAGRVVGAKRPLKPNQVWAISFWLRHRQQAPRMRRPSKRKSLSVAVGLARALSRGAGEDGLTRVQFELLEQACGSMSAWLDMPLRPRRGRRCRRRPAAYDLASCR